MGELIAEIAACYLTNELGIPNAEPLENHAAYLQSWLKSMKSDPNFIFKAAKQRPKSPIFCSHSCDNPRQKRNWLRPFEQFSKAKPMSKPFLVVNIIEGELGVIHERDTWEDALDTAVNVAAEQCEVPKEEIRKELEEDSNFFVGRHTLKVYIARETDDD